MYAIDALAPLSQHQGIVHGTVHSICNKQQTPVPAQAAQTLHHTLKHGVTPVQT